MIVERLTWQVKPGHVDEFAELLKAERERYSKIPARIYKIWVGPFNVVAWEGEFESDEERHKFWTDWLAQPQAQTLMKNMTELQDPGGSRELWVLE